MSFILSLIIGCIAGFLAGKLFRDRSFGVFINTLLGLVGGAVGSLVYSLLDIQTSGGNWGQFVMSFIGACIILIIANIFRKK